MDQQPQNNLFEITVNQEGAERLLRYFKLAKWMFALGIAVSVLMIAMTIFRLRIYVTAPIADPVWKAEMVFSMVYGILVILIVPVQLFCYFYFGRLCKKSIDLRQEFSFNDSLKWLVRGVILSTCLIATELLAGIFSLYVLNYTVQKLSPAP